MSGPKIYQCPICGLHYYDEKIVEACEAFCREHNACSLEITQHSLENQKMKADHES